MTTTPVLTDPPKMLVRDPICGMEFNPAGAAAWRILDGQTYYFCAERCARRFDRQHPGTLTVMPASQIKEAEVSAEAPQSQMPSFPAWLVPAAAALLVAAVLAVTVFGVSLGNVFLFAMVLACPLMHLFMMRGHQHH